MKQAAEVNGDSQDRVAPYAGAWIETEIHSAGASAEHVAPYAGAWIETWFCRFLLASYMSLPTRERGLKLTCKHINKITYGRSLRGSVD